MCAVIVAYREGWQEVLPHYGQRPEPLPKLIVEEEPVGSTLSCVDAALRCSAPDFPFLPVTQAVAVSSHCALPPLATSTYHLLYWKIFFFLGMTTFPVTLKSSLHHASPTTFLSSSHDQRLLKPRQRTRSFITVHCWQPTWASSSTFPYFCDFNLHFKMTSFLNSISFFF